MNITLDFPELLRLIDDRSSAFRAAVAAAPDLDVRVPTCPEWTLLDLVRHLGEGRRAWAATIAAGPDATSKSAPQGYPAPREREALLAWLAESTRQLVDALREAGPDRGCWTWWGRSQTPRTCGAVARHQLHEIAVHTYDAQLAVGAPQSLPDAIALDGVEEFLFTLCTTTVAWPYRPAAVDYHVTEGCSWRNWVSGDGARVARLPVPGRGPAPDGEPDGVDASALGTANDLLLAFYGRIPLDSLKLNGDRDLLDRLAAWDPEE
ncbi:maleylpyruvate isomerase N-terminal domain-containing protein [Streptomyces sp. NBC_00102]|uniref:maleylpyruvate isomerase N-terminal domain-containing protein n=1 Tax=Streptomyces sp. NBC_00102 TaxID=2975652 RepID=UPI00224F175C|nr:maleylpyruvate isomerase N-terminal domain-containing protein [Streptomyces sp. NBC_00102]MCX5401459.1 maleylpyruvate isomerase N-terminal domain-containing protein [Streptomyces sp. NBC_00102]